MHATDEITTGYSPPTPKYVHHDKAGGALKKMRVVCVGAGLSGIYLGIRLPMITQNIELTIYEKNSDVGGTWHENVYPGCACDVPAHRYCYTFNPNPSWSNFFAPSAEIQAYFHNSAQKYDALKYIKLNHKVVSALWNESSAKWDLLVANEAGQIFSDSCDVLVNAMGVLNNWRWPTIDGLKSFKGKLLHSAAYDNSVDLTGKKVAVIGSGSSGIQIIPAIQAKVSHLGAYLRSPTWIVPPFGSEYISKDAQGEYIFEYTEEERANFANNPDAFLEYRRVLEKDVSSRFRMYIKGDPSQDALRPTLVNYMKSRLAKRPELAEKLIPNWAVGCRRLTPGVGYLEALCENHVEPIFSDIERIDATGIISGGEHRDYDIIICATGFDVSYGARFEFRGRDGAKLDAAFHAEPKSYLAVASAGFPNYFMFNGPNAPVGAGSLVPATEAQGDYIIKAITKIQTQGIASMVPTDASVRNFIDHTDSFMSTTVWTDSCRSWYKNGKVDGRVTALWPGSGLHYIGALADPRWEDYSYTYDNPLNRFAYLGNGFTPLEIAGGDRTFDLGERTSRMDSHPALQGKGAALVYNKQQTVLVACDPASVILGTMKVES